MKNHKEGNKTARKSANQLLPHSSVGNNAVALTPPEYGIDFVDHQPIKPSVEPVQLQTAGARGDQNTGMPDSLKEGLEQLSGFDLSAVRVHYNSTKPAQLNALAYAQGHDIEVAPGQERHLPHEGWHLIQQMQGRVQPTSQVKSVSLNDDVALEREADLMGAKAMQMTSGDPVATRATSLQPTKEIASPIHKSEAQQQTIQCKKGFFGGLLGGAALGGAVAGPAGALGGAIGGAVLGPLFEWWNNLPDQDRLPFTANDLNVGGQNLRQTGGPAPYAPSPNPADQMLDQGKRNLRQTTGPMPHIPSSNPADQMLDQGKQNLRQTDGPVPRDFQVNTADLINPTNLAMGRQSLAHTQVGHQLDAVDGPGADWKFKIPFDPKVVPTEEQTKGKRLDEMILLPEGVKIGRVLFRSENHQNLPGNTILGVGTKTIRYCYETTSGQMSAPRITALHIKPTTDELMTEMGFVKRGWRWDLPWGFHGTLNKNFHLSVPVDEQIPLDRMDSLSDILERIFPLGEELGGTHISIECRAGNSPTMNNAAYFLNGSPKYPKGYSTGEQNTYVAACKSRLSDWKKQRSRLLQEALSRL